MLRKALLAVCVLFLLPALALAQDGKLRGKVTDKESGDPLIGANVILDGTSLGAAADLNGDYVILGVPPGVYTVKVSYIGYQPVSLANVRINAGITTSQDFKLASSAIEVGSLEVVAERPLIQRNTTNTVRLTTTEDIQNLPIRGLQSIIALNAGTVQQNGTLYIRGGRQNEVAYFVDGVTATNPFFNNENVSVVQEAVEEIQLQSGGFTAEFGGANSGVVRTTLRTGGSSFKATLDYRTDDFAKPGEEFLGTTSLGERIVVATAGGPLGSKLRYFVTGQHRYMRNRTAVFIEPFRFDGLLDDGLSGRTADVPLPDAVVFKRNHLPNNQRYDNQGQATLVYNYSNALKFRLSGSYQFVRLPTGYNTFYNSLPSMFENRDYRDDTKTGLAGLKMTHLINPTTFYEVNLNWTGRYFRGYDPDFGDDWVKYADSRELAAKGYDVSEWQSLFEGPLNYSTIFDFEFTPRNDLFNSYSKNSQTSLGASVDFTSQLNKNIELKLGGRLDYWTMRAFSVGNISNYLNYLYGRDGTNPHTFADDYVRRVELGNAGGILYYGWDVDGKNKINSGVLGPRHPLFGSGYVQTKMEYRDLILNVGLRYERIDAKVLQPINPELQPEDYDALNLFIKESAVTETDAYDYLLPRLNFSFPVTDRTVFYAQYGKYIQMPRLTDLYNGGLRKLSTDVLPETRSVYGYFSSKYVGFTAKPERTDQYELGIRQTLTDNFAFTLTAFYKDLRDQLRLDRFLADGSGTLSAGAPVYVGWFNNDIGTSKGLEMTLELRRTKRLSARVNYTLSNTRGTGSDSRSTSVAVSDAIVAYPIFTYNLEQNQAHRGTILLDYRFARGDGGSILQGLGLNAILTFNSGHNYTKIEEPLNLGQSTPWTVGTRATRDPRFRHPLEPLNSSTTPWNFNVDLNLDKLFYLGNFNVKVYANVLNAFNTKNIINLYETTGTDDDDGWLKNPLAGQYIAIPNYEEFYRAINLDNGWGYYYATANYLWSTPRQIRLGVMLEF